MYTLWFKCKYKVWIIQKVKKIVNGLFGINNLNENVNNDLCSLNIQKKQDKSDDWSEHLQTENRLGFKLSQSDKLCAITTGTHWVWDIGNLKDVNIHHTYLKLVKKLLLQGLFQYLDVFPLQKSITSYF